MPVILFIDEIHLVLGAGASGDGAMDAANLLKPMLSRGELRCIGATTLDEYRKYVEKDPAFERRFRQVLVKEPSEDTLYNPRGIRGRTGRTTGCRSWTRRLSLRRCRSRASADGSCRTRRSTLSTRRTRQCTRSELVKENDTFSRKTQLEVEQAALQREVKEGGAAEKTTARFGEIGKELAERGEKLREPRCSPRGLRAAHAAERGGSGDDAGHLGQGGPAVLLDPGGGEACGARGAAADTRTG